MPNEVQHGDMVLGGEGLPDLPDTQEPSFPESPPIQMNVPSHPVGHMQPPTSAPDGVPRFEVVPVKLADGSYINREYVTILIPGDNKNLPRHKVTDGLRDKYRPWYDMWRKGLQETPMGTPLEMWPVLSPAEVMMLKHNNIFTVEQLIEMSEANDDRIPMAKTLRRKARDWLRVKKEAHAIEADAAEREMLRSGMSQLEEQNRLLAEKVEGLLAEREPAPLPPSPSPADDTARKRGPGRPPKNT